MSTHNPDLSTLKEMSEELVGPELDARIPDILPDAMVVVNGQRKIVRFNPKAELLFGYSRVEVMGARIELLIPEELRARHEAHVTGYVDDPTPRPMGTGQVLLARHKDGRSFPVEINLGPVVLTTGLFICAIVRRVKTRKGDSDARGTVVGAVPGTPDQDA